MRKKISVCILVMALTMALPIAALAENPAETQAETPATAPSIYIDGFLLTTDVPATIIDYHTLAPMRAVFEALGAVVEWNGETQTATGTTATRTVTLTLNSTTAYVDQTAVELDIAAQVISDHILVPLRFISESLGAGVDYDGTNIYITTADSTDSQSPDARLFSQMLDKGKAVTELSYTVVITTGSDVQSKTFNVKGDKYQAEYTNAEGDAMIEIADKSAITLCQYSPVTKKGILLTADDLVGIKIWNPATWMEGAEASKAAYTGEETLDGKPCYVFDYAEKDGQTTRIWFWQENGIPLKMSGLLDGQSTIKEFQDVTVGGVDASLFVVPADITMIEH